MRPVGDVRTESEGTGTLQRRMTTDVQTFEEVRFLNSIILVVADADSKKATLTRATRRGGHLITIDNGPGTRW